MTSRETQSWKLLSTSTGRPERCVQGEFAIFLGGTGGMQGRTSNYFLKRSSFN